MENYKFNKQYAVEKKSSHVFMIGKLNWKKKDWVLRKFLIR